MYDAFLVQLETLIGACDVDLSQDPPVFRPSTEESTAELVKRCHESGRGIRITGGGTFPSAEGDRSLVRLSMRGHAGITEMNTDDYLILVKAGEPVDRLVAHAAGARMHLPVDLPSGDSATIGGTFMSGAFVSGTASDGSLRKMVIGIRAITSRGEIVKFGGRTVKNVTGFEVTRFLTGTMGLYAIAAELIVKALPAPEHREILTITVEPGEFGAITNLLGDGLEMANRVVLFAPEGIGGKLTADIHFEGFRPIINKDMGVIAGLVEGLPGITALAGDIADFKNRHRSLARVIFGPELYSVALPAPAVPVFLDRLARIAPLSPVIGHFRFGRFYISGLDEEAARKLDTEVRVLGGSAPVKWGSISGVASLLTAPERAIARSLKRELDPRGILNPHIQF